MKMEIIVPREKIEEALSLIQEYSDVRWASGNEPLEFIPDGAYTYCELTIDDVMTYMYRDSATSNYNEFIEEIRKWKEKA